MKRMVMILFLLALCGVAPAEQPPNIIVVLADDLGYGDVQCYNPESTIPTPNMDRLAREGMRFTDAHSASGVCTPSRYTLLTGRYSWRGKLKDSVLFGYSPSLIEPGRATLATLCKEAGYDTACIGKWHLGLGLKGKTDYSQPLNPNPTHFGFDTFFGIPASLDMDPYVYVENDHVITQPTGHTDGNDPKGPGFWRAGPMAPDFDHAEVLPKLQQRALDFLRAPERGARPFFLYFPLTSPHTPCLPTEEFRGKTGVGDYGDFVVQTDAVLGSLMDALQSAGLDERTLIVFSSDNGANQSHVPDDSTHQANRPWRGKKADAWEGGHRVPFLVRWPGVVAAGSVCDRACGQVDVFATVCEMLGRKVGTEEGEDSVSLLPLWQGKEWNDEGRTALIHHSSNGVFAVRKGNWKLINAVGGGGFGWDKEAATPKPGEPMAQLYDLAADPAETNNQFDTNPQQAEAMLALLKRCREEGRTVARQ
jgi:arylsulfatase A-like enzyme